MQENGGYSNADWRGVGAAAYCHCIVVGATAYCHCIIVTATAY